MSFWNSEKIKKENKRLKDQHQKELVDPFEEEFIQHAAYELSLGPEVFVTSGGKGKKQSIDSGKKQIIIPPGQFGLLLTNETVAIPDSAIGFISIRFSIKQRGLVNVSGFHVDPGFVGRLKFAVYNAGSQNIVLSYGQRVFLIWFSDLSEPSPDLYDGEHANQNEITSEDVMRIQGEVASPAALKKKVDTLQNEMMFIRLLLIGLILAIAGAYAKVVLDEKRAPVTGITPAIPTKNADGSPPGTAQRSTDGNSTNPPSANAAKSPAVEPSQ